MKKIVFRPLYVAITFVLLFLLAGCVERRYYRVNRTHTDHYIRVHPKKHHHWYKHHH